MDIFTHALVGAITGAAFGHPIVGAVVATAPDIGIAAAGSFLHRLKAPTVHYDIGHSLLCVAICTAMAATVFDTAVWLTVLFALLSHLWLDLPTHGETWGVRLFFPFKWRYGGGSEWEFFNPAWFTGLLWGFVWVWIVITVHVVWSFVTGFQL